MIKDINITSVNADKSKQSIEQLGGAVDKTASSLKNINEDVKKLDTSLKNFEGAISRFNQNFNQSIITVGEVRNQLSQLNSTLSSVNTDTLSRGLVAINSNSQSVINTTNQLGLSYRGVGTQLNNTNTSLLSTSNGFLNASTAGNSLSGSLGLLGISSSSAASGMSTASSGVGLYTASTVGAVGSTLSLEQGITQLVNIMSSEADITKKVTDQMKIRKEMLTQDAKAIKERIDSVNLAIHYDQENIELAKKGVEVNKQRGLSTKNYEAQIKDLQKSIQKYTKDEDNLQKELYETNSRLFQVNSALTRYQQEQRRASVAVQNTTESVQQSTNTISQNGRAVGNAGRQMTSFADVLGRAFQWFSAYAVVSKFFGIIKDGINTIKDFSKEISRLSAITGLPKASEELKILESQAIALGKATEYTSKQIVELQIELAKLGLKSKDILASTNSISAGATAMGSSLSETAKLGATTMKAFGLQASDMDQIMGALTKSTTKSALSFEYLTTALPYAATAGSALGFELEEVLALLSGLADAGFKSSQAGTGLRNIFSKLADETKKLGKELGPIRNLDDMANAFDELVASGIDLGKAFELTDARAMNQFLTLVKNRKAVKELAEEYKNTAGVLDEMREKQLDNLAGSLTLLTSAWDGLMLKFSNSEGVLKKTTDIFRELINYVGELIGDNEDKVNEGISTKISSTTRVLSQVTKELTSKYKEDSEIIKQVNDLVKEKGVDFSQTLNVIATNKAREEASDSMLESLNEELEREQELLNLAELRYNSSDQFSKKQMEIEKENFETQKGIVDGILKSIEATKAYKKELQDLPLNSPNRVNEVGGGSVKNNRRDEAEKEAERQRRASIGELARLKEDYDARKALLEEFGLSTVHLTFNYEEQVKEIQKKYSDAAINETKRKVEEQERLEKEAKKKRYDEFMLTVNDEANNEIIKWKQKLEANQIGSLEYDNQMIQINLKRLQDEYNFLSESENQTAESEQRKTEIIKEQLEERKKLNNINLEIATQGMDAIANIMGAGSKLAKENSKAQKAMAISEVIVNTVSGGITAVKKSIDTFGMPVGPIIGGAQAAAMALSGAAAIKQIKNADKGGNISSEAASAVAPPPISMIRNVLGQEDIELQKSIIGDISPVVRVVDIEKGLSRSNTKVKESSF